MGLYDKFKAGLQKTRDLTLGKLTDLFLRGRVDGDLLERLEEALLEADVGVETVDSLVENLKERAKLEKTVGRGQVIGLLKDELTRLMVEPALNRPTRFSVKPWVVVLAGVNGSGKTTTAGKLAHLYAQEGKKTAIAAADTFRAAAIEQVEIWAQRGGARLIKQSTGADPASVAFDAYNSVKARGEDGRDGERPQSIDAGLHSLGKC